MTRRSSHRGRNWFGGLLVAGALCLSACVDRNGLDDDTGGPAALSEFGVVFHRGTGSEPDTLDPHRSEETSAAEILRDLYEGLTVEGPDGEIRPGVAERWQISEDGRTYTFHLRKDARWSNGDPVTAADFVAALRRSLDPATGTTYAQMLQPIEQADDILAGRSPPDALGVVARSDQTLEIRLKAPTPYLLQMLTHSATYPVHRPSLAEHGDQFARPGRLVSNGAYRLDEWIVQSHIRARRNEHYWDTANAQIDTVYYYPIEQPEAELKRYRADQLDFTESLPNARFGWLSDNMGDDLRVAAYLSTYYYLFNMTRPPFDDRRLRQALNMVIDRDVLVEKVTGVGEIAAYGFVPPGMRDYTPQRFEWHAWPAEQRLSTARELYREAGFGPDAPLRFVIRYNTGENHKKLALALASMWKQALGVEATLLNEEWKVYLQNRKNRSLWELLRFSWSADYNDPFSFAEIMHSTHGQNDTGFADARYDRLIEAAAIETDREQRRAMLEEAERLVLDAYPILPLYFYVTKHLVKPWVGGYRPNPLDHNYTKYLSIDTEARGH